jgi:hypothetical protein
VRGAGSKVANARESIALCGDAAKWRLRQLKNDRKKRMAICHLLFSKSNLRLEIKTVDRDRFIQTSSMFNKYYA